MHKTCVRDVHSESPLNLDEHPDNTDTFACSFGVRINRVPLYISQSWCWKHPCSERKLENLIVLEWTEMTPAFRFIPCYYCPLFIPVFGNACLHFLTTRHYRTLRETGKKFEWSIPDLVPEIPNSAQWKMIDEKTRDTRDDVAFRLPKISSLFLR